MSTYSPSSTAEKCSRFERCPEKLTRIFTFLDSLKEDLNIQKNYNVKQWADIMILACRPEARIPGLGTELVKEGMRLMEQQGITVSFRQKNDALKKTSCL